MANTFLPPDDGSGHEAPHLRPVDDAHLDDLVIEEQGSVLSSLLGNLKDVFFPVKLPPLVLESKPIAVVDRMATKQNPAATGSAIIIYTLLVLLIGWVFRHKVVSLVTKPVQVVELNVPPQAPPKLVSMGGGGGQKGPTPVTKGTPPPPSPHQIVPPMAPPKIDPKLAVPPTVDIQKDLKMASSIPQIGVANSPLVGVASMGNGSGGGLGSGNGNGIGPGSGGNTGGGPRRIGGGVSAPEVRYKVDPEFSEEARKAKVAGNVLVNLWVDTNGLPTHVHVIRGVGMGLDEKAVEAVKQYRFKPAMENGKPVLVELNIEVNFQIF
jgi:protein TonB